MIVRLARASSSHGETPAEHEVVEVDTDTGEASGVRTWAEGSVGRFARRLTKSERTELCDAAGRAAAAGKPSSSAAKPRRPESGNERITIDGHLAIEVDPYDDPPEAWADLVDALRELVDTIVSSPVAAIELVVDTSVHPVALSLRHSGSESISIRLEHVTVSARIADEGEATVASAKVRSSGTSSPEAGRPGWQWDIPVTLDLPVPSAGQSLEVTVDVDIDAEADNRWRRNRITAAVDG